MQAEFATFRREPVVHYRCYFLDRNRKRSVAEDIAAASDDEALRRARHLFSSWPMFPAFELWQGERCIRQEERTPLSA